MDDSTKKLEGLGKELLILLQALGKREVGANEVADLLKRGAPVNQKDSNGSRAIHLACYNNRADIVKVLLEYKASINEQTDKVLDTPMHIACQRGSLSCVKLLVATGKCDLGLMNSNGRTPLGEAAHSGQLNIVEYFIAEHKVNVEDNVNKAGNTLLELAICEGQLHIFKYLVSKKEQTIEDYVNKAGNTLLELAICKGQLDIIKYLVNQKEQRIEEKHLVTACVHERPRVVEYFLADLNINPNAKDESEKLALSLTKNKEVMILLLQHGAVSEDVYTHYCKKLGYVFPYYPLKNSVKMFVVGREGEGKSSLIKALGDEPTVWSSFANKFVTLKEVEGVGESTAGIIPRIFNSQYHHDIQFFDFAGQETYYSNHAAFLKSAVDTCSPVFILVIGLHHKEDARITKSVSYWLGIITDQCPRMEGKAPLIVVASHSDQVKDKNDIDKKTQTITTAVEKFPSFELKTIIPMDCRYSDSSGMKLFRTSVRECCALIQSKLSVSLNSHIFHLFLIENYPDKVYITLKEVQIKLKEKFNSFEEVSKKHKDKISFIPTTISRLVDICLQLSDKGHIVFLQDEASLEDSFIVINYKELLSEIEKTKFAQHKTDSKMSTGVVPCSKLAGQFPDFDIKMIVKFLMYLKLAHPIKDLEVLSHIEKESTKPSQGYMFCPALIQVDSLAMSEWYREHYLYHFGWILSCTKSEHFLDDRFLRVLILRLAFQHKPAEANSDCPALERFCSVWKTGVCWSTADGLEVRVEVHGMKTVVLLVQAQKLSAGLFCVQSSSIRKIVEAAVDFSPSVDSEELLVNASSVKSFEGSPRVSLKHVAHSIVQKKSYVVTDTGIKSSPMKEFLWMEVYANLGENILQLLFNENDPAHHTKVTNRFIAALISSWNETPELQTVIFSIFAREIPGPQKNTDNLETVIKLWRDLDHNDGTYHSLRQTLDQVSVFAGKNPLKIAGVSTKKFSEDLLPKAIPQPTSAGLTIEDLQTETGVSDLQLDKKIKESDLNGIADFFEDVETYLDNLGLDPGQKTDIKDLAKDKGTKTAIVKALKLWRQPNPIAATFRALLWILIHLRKGDIAIKVCRYIKSNYPSISVPSEGNRSERDQNQDQTQATEEPLTLTENPISAASRENPTDGLRTRKRPPHTVSHTSVQKLIATSKSQGRRNRWFIPLVLLIVIIFLMAVLLYVLLY